MTECDSADDDMPPELEDMSETIAAARKMRSERSPAVSAPKHDTALYSAVVDDPAKPDPVAAPLAADTRVRVSGLAKAAQYNGQSGVVKGFDHEARRYEVLLKSGKTLKIKRDNMELLDGAVKGGFLSQSKPAKPAGEGGPQVVRPTGKKEGILDGIKSLKMNQEDVPEWMKPNDDLLNKVKQDNELASGVDNPKITRAIDEISKDPQAWLKYQNDPEVKSYFGKMMGLFGQQFQQHEERNAQSLATAAAETKKAGQGKTADKSKLQSSVKIRPVEEEEEEEEAAAATEVLMGAARTTRQASKPLIQELSTPAGTAFGRETTSGAQAGAAVAEACRPAKGGQGAAVRKGTTDYSKWDAIDSDDDCDDAPAARTGGQDVLGIPGLTVGKISDNDPRVEVAKADAKLKTRDQRAVLSPKVAVTLTCLPVVLAQADPAAIEALMADADVAEKMRVLIQAGVVDIRRPGQ